MATASGQVTKIYEVKTLGFSTTHKEFETLSKDLEKLRQAKIALNNTKGTLLDANEIADNQRKINAVTEAQAKTISASRPGVMFNLPTSTKKQKPVRKIWLLNSG
jgi:hypothetical protein